MLNLFKGNECERVHVWLWDLDCGDLSAAAAEKVRRHVSGCVRCSSELEFARKSMAATSHLSARTAETQRGWAEIRQRLTSEPRGEAVPSRRPLAWALGAAAAVIAIAMWLNPGASKSPMPVPTVAGIDRHDPVGSPKPIVPRSAPRIAATNHSRDKSAARLVSDRVLRRTAVASRIVKVTHGPRPTVPPIPAVDEASTLVTVQRSSEISAKSDGARLLLVSGTMPSSGPESGAQVTGSAPTSISFDERAVSVETAWDKETDP